MHNFAAAAAGEMLDSPLINCTLVYIMFPHAADNLARLMANAGLTVRQVAVRSGVDERTVRAILSRQRKPRASTIKRLANGLAIAPHEFCLEPQQMGLVRFDRATNPAVEQLLEDCPELFAGWTAGDFNELYSRVGAGGPLTRHGARQAVEHMNRKRRLHEQLDLLLESSLAEVTAELIQTLCKAVVIQPSDQTDRSF